MGRPPERLPQTFEQMVASNEASKPKKWSRREIIEANKQEISDLIGDLADRLAEGSAAKMDIRDTERVKSITQEYLRSCQYTGTLPTIAGLSLAMGYTQEGIIKFCNRNPNHETAKFWKMVKEHFADLLNQASLAGDVAPIPAIFTLKSNYGWNDQPEPVSRNNSDDMEDLSPETIAAKYDDLPD